MAARIRVSPYRYKPLEPLVIDMAEATTYAHFDPVTPSPRYLPVELHLKIIKHLADRFKEAWEDRQLLPPFFSAGMTTDIEPLVDCIFPGFTTLPHLTADMLKAFLGCVTTRGRIRLQDHVVHDDLVRPDTLFAPTTTGMSYDLQERAAKYMEHLHLDVSINSASITSAPASTTTASPSLVPATTNLCTILRSVRASFHRVRSLTVNISDPIYQWSTARRTLFHLSPLVGEMSDMDFDHVRLDFIGDPNDDEYDLGNEVFEFGVWNQMDSVSRLQVVKETWGRGRGIAWTKIPEGSQRSLTHEPQGNWNDRSRLWRMEKSFGNRDRMPVRQWYEHEQEREYL